MPQNFLDNLPDKDLEHILSTLPNDKQEDAGYWDEKGIWHPKSKGGELKRKDTTIFDLPFEGAYHKVADISSKLPGSGTLSGDLLSMLTGGSVKSLQEVGGILGSLALYPAEVLKDILSAPETPAISLAGSARSAAETAAKYAHPEELVPFPDPRTKPTVGLLPESRAEQIAREAVQPQPRIFAGGPSESAGQVVPIDLAEADPRKYYAVAGQVEDIPARSVNLDEVREADRLRNLVYGPAEQYPGSRLSLPESSRLNLPLESGDVTGGFAPQTASDMEWPYNVVPNTLRPRAAQTEVLGQTGIAGIDFPTGQGARYTLNSSGVSAEMLERPTPIDPDNPFIGPPRRFEPTPDIATGTGAPTELLAPGSRAPISEILDDLPHPNNPPLDVKYSAPKIPTSVNDINRIPPGQIEAPPIMDKNGMSFMGAHFTSPHVVTEQFPISKPIIDPIMRANDEKYKWLATIQREFSDLSSGLSKQDRKSLTYILNGEEVPGVSEDIMTRAERAKQLLDSVWEMANDSSPEGVGFIDRYITHIKSQPEDFQSAVKSIIENQFGKESGIYKAFTHEAEGSVTKDIGDFFEKGIGSPTSNFIKTRRGQLQDIETDYNRILPVYLESMAKVIFDRPAVDIAKEGLKEIPTGKLKEYLTGYIKNYSRYDADAELARAGDALANQIATTNARSVIAFNPVVHMYHLGQLPANVWPELGTKYSLAGAKHFLQHPVQGYQELAKLGLFSNQIRPMNFQTPMQKFDSISYFMNYVESIVKGTGYYGFKQKAIDMGMSDMDATMYAINQTKNATATVDPARHMRYFTPESNIFGGQLSRLGKQYHQIPMKLVEQLARAAQGLKNDPAKAARYIAGTSIAAAGAGAGLHTLHINPVGLAETMMGGAGQVGTVMGRVYRDLSKGDLASALKDIAEWRIPGGSVIRRLRAK